MQDDFNPFPIYNYVSKEYFCDREDDLKRLRKAMANQRNVRLISLRKLGKSALLHHFFKNQRKYVTVYLDIYRIRSEEEFIQKLVEEVVNQIGRPGPGLMKRILETMRSIDLNVGFDEVTGLPRFGVSVRPTPSRDVTMRELFQFLDQQKKVVIIAIDEFQQVMEFSDGRTDALLREYIQQSKNIRFIFSGSDQRMMAMLFSDHKRPFYQSTEPIHLDYIDQRVYNDFIRGHFQSAEREIAPEVIDRGLTWARCHTYYVQFLFNRLYGLGLKKYEESDLLQVRNSILREHGSEFKALTKLLSPHQAKLLLAIAKAGNVDVPTRSSFIREHGLSAVSTVRQALGVLEDKELIHRNESGYMVTNVFLSRWLESDI
ncbi:MAG: ATP-binding protein [Flavobacteriales bacterium]|nr:ATP-binding protein [Flavobacteriales bacterium]